MATARKSSILSPLAIPRVHQAYKNLGRTRHILSVFAMHGFYQIIETVGLSKLLPFQKKPEESEPLKHTIAERLCLAFEQLGPTFVKFGQMLASRPDLLTPSFAKAFNRLRDDVKPVPYSEIRTVLEEALDEEISTLFASFDEQPLAAASIAQVHAARLADGTDVVVKIQRPGIAKILDTDLSILYFLAKLAERYIPELKLYNPVEIVDEFTRLMRSATDFMEEAHNIDEIHENFSDDADIVIPRIYWELTSKHVLTMERIHGVPLHDIERLKTDGYDFKRICATGVNTFLKQVFIDGVFHADLHGGNIFVLPENRLAFVDFGEVGRLGSHTRVLIANLFASLLSRDFQGLARNYIDLGTQMAPIDMLRFAEDLEKLLGQLFGRKIREVDLGVVLTKAAGIAAKHRIRLPRDLVLIGRVIITMEDLIRKLDPEFDLLAAGGRFAGEIVKKQLRPENIARDLIWNLKDLSELSKTLPSQIKYVVQKLQRNDLSIRFELDHLTRAIGVMDSASKRVASAIVVMGLVIGSSILTFSKSSNGETFGTYHLGLVGYVVAGLFGLGLLYSLLRSKE